MNKRILKRIMPLAIVAVKAVSTSSATADSELNLNRNTMYCLEFTTAGSDGTSKDDILIKINGTNGSTDWHNVKTVAKKKTGSMMFFSKKDVGTIKSISVKNDGSDGWYPEIIKITAGEKTTTIYGGRWVDDGKEVTLAVTDRVAKVTVQTKNFRDSGTDGDVLLKLVDEKGNSTGETNLSSIHPKANAFERYDRATFYIHIPENFGELKEIRVNLDGSQESWGLAYIDVTLDGETKIFPCNACVTDKIETLNTIGYLYKVTVKTSDKFLAGTDDDVILYTYDENGKPINCSEFQGKYVNRYWLESDDNNFERNATDVFYISSPKKTADIKMECENVLGTKWHLDYVQLDLMDGDNVVESTKYNYNQCMEYSKRIAPNSKEVLL